MSKIKSSGGKFCQSEFIERIISLLFDQFQMMEFLVTENLLL